MGKSAKESFAEFVQFLKSDPNAKLTRHEIAELEDILANNKLEWRHLIPHAVAGEKSQTADNLFAGTDYANSYDLCVEQALLGKNGQLKNSNFHIRCKETYLNGDDKNNIGIRREYRIINLKNAKTITIEYPTFINQKPSINCIPAFSELINNELE